MQYLDRHRLALLVEYTRIAASGEREPTATEAVTVFLRILFDQASAAGREAFIRVTENRAGTWPWTAIEPIELDIDTDDELLARISFAPPALILLIARDTTEADALDPANVVSDEVASGPLLGALQRWEPRTIESSITPEGWTRIEDMPTVEPDPPGGTPPVPDAQPDPAVEPPAPPNGKPPSPGPSVTTTTPWYQRWEVWAGVAAVSGVLAVVGVGVSVSRRAPELPEGA